MLRERGLRIVLTPETNPLGLELAAFRNRMIARIARFGFGNGIFN
jgi:hypothetical protein